MRDVPAALLEQVERGNVVLIIGERIVRDEQGQVLTDYLTAHLAAQGELPAEEQDTFAEVAQMYADRHGRAALIACLREQIANFGAAPQPIHHHIATLHAGSLLVTTCIDDWIEQACTAANRPFEVVTGDLDVATLDEPRTQIYKLRGSLDQPESLVLTEDDEEALFTDPSRMPVLLRGHLAQTALLFLGYDLADPSFKALFRWITTALDNFTQPIYALAPEIPPRAARWCIRHNITLIECDPLEFLTQLAAQRDRRTQTAAQQHQPTVAEEHTLQATTTPYKLLDYYEAKDAAIFFGRQQETRRLSALIQAHRLVLVFGASGVGKTSLLLAGVAPRLERGEPSDDLCARAGRPESGHSPGIAALAARHQPTRRDGVDQHSQHEWRDDPRSTGRAPGDPGNALQRE